MGFPTLKYPRICRLVPYILVIGAFAAPVVIVCALPVYDFIKIIAFLLAACGLVYYIIRNFLVLMSMDMLLAQLSCQRTARTKYQLPPGRTAESIRRSILRYGTACDPGMTRPEPSALRYKHSNSLSVYAKGIERVIAAYEVDDLDRELYRSICRSARDNSAALAGKKKSILTDPAQKSAPMHRVTVIVIMAHRIHPQLKPGLYELVCKQCGDEEKNCLVPCVIDLEDGSCVFNCLRVPYVGFSYAVKNRGIRLIKHRVFGGNLNLAHNTNTLDIWKDFSPESTIWDLWKQLYHEIVRADKETRRRFEAMEDRQILADKDFLYLKWEQRGVCQRIETDPQRKRVKVEPVEDWYYPKMQPISKKTIAKITDEIVGYYKKLGYTVEFVCSDETPLDT